MKKIVLALIYCGVLIPAFAQVKLTNQLMKQLISDTTFNITKDLKETNLHYLNTAGEKMAVFILNAKLKNGRTGLEAATPFNKDTFCRQAVIEQMKWDDTLNHHVLAGVNADFFNVKNGVPLEMVNKGGRLIKDKMLSKRGFMGVLKNGNIIIGDSVLYEKDKKRLKEALGGWQLLVKNGHVLPQDSSKFSITHHPRTAAGIINKHTLILVVVDGRQPDYSNGMSLTDLASLMKQLGARTAINLDGGGSSTMVSTDPASGKWKIRNRPSDKQERKVADSWEIVSY